MRGILVGLGGLLFATSLAFGQQPADNSGKKDTHKFNKAEYFEGTSGGQKKAGSTVKGTLFFDAENKTVNFLQESGSPAISIKYELIKNMMYEKTSKPRYAEAVLISPLFLLSHSKKHYLTFQYTDPTGEGRYAIVRLDKGNARQAVACAEAQIGKRVEQTEEK
jgi:hypothetical protein